jgi:hypothetical protein
MYVRRTLPQETQRRFLAIGRRHDATIAEKALTPYDAIQRKERASDYWSTAGRRRASLPGGRAMPDFLPLAEQKHANAAFFVYGVSFGRMHIFSMIGSREKAIRFCASFFGICAQWFFGENDKKGMTCKQNTTP